jgi:hypothetical protein
MSFHFSSRRFYKQYLVLYKKGTVLFIKIKLFRYVSNTFVIQLG